MLTLGIVKFYDSRENHFGLLRDCVGAKGPWKGTIRFVAKDCATSEPPKSDTVVLFDLELTHPGKRVHRIRPLESATRDELTKVVQWSYGNAYLSILRQLAKCSPPGTTQEWDSWMTPIRTVHLKWQLALFNSVGKEIGTEHFIREHGTDELRLHLLKDTSAPVAPELLLRTWLFTSEDLTDRLFTYAQDSAALMQEMPKGMNQRYQVWVMEQEPWILVKDMRIRPTEEVYDRLIADALKLAQMLASTLHTNVVTANMMSPFSMYSDISLHEGYELLRAILKETTGSRFHQQMDLRGVFDRLLENGTRCLSMKSSSLLNEFAGSLTAAELAHYKEIILGSLHHEINEQWGLAKGNDKYLLVPMWVKRIAELASVEDREKHLEKFKAEMLACLAGSRSMDAIQFFSALRSAGLAPSAEVFLSIWTSRDDHLDAHSIPQERGVLAGIIEVRFKLYQQLRLGLNEVLPTDLASTAKAHLEDVLISTMATRGLDQALEVMRVMREELSQTACARIGDLIEGYGLQNIDAFIDKLSTILDYYPTTGILDRVILQQNGPWEVQQLRRLLREDLSAEVEEHLYRDALPKLFKANWAKTMSYCIRKGMYAEMDEEMNGLYSERDAAWEDLFIGLAELWPGPTVLENWLQKGKGPAFDWLRLMFCVDLEIPAGHASVELPARLELRTIRFMAYRTYQQGMTMSQLTSQLARMSLRSISGTVAAQVLTADWVSAADNVVEGFDRLLKMQFAAMSEHQLDAEAFMDMFSLENITPKCHGRYDIYGKRGAQLNIYCEGRWWKKDGYKELFWCRGSVCLHVAQQADLGKHINRWTLLELIKLKGVVLDRFLVHQIAGWANRMNTIMDRLSCRACKAMLRPLPFDPMQLGFYAVPLFQCVAQNCSEYGSPIRFTHCKGCGSILDSRDHVKCSNGWLKCTKNGCGYCCPQHAGDHSYTPVFVEQ